MFLNQPPLNLDPYVTFLVDFSLSNGWKQNPGFEFKESMDLIHILQHFPSTNTEKCYFLQIVLF